MKVTEADALVRKFGDLTAVDGVSFDVEQGEFFGFLVPNGAGKTTTINMLCTLLRPTAGTATVNGYDIARQPDEDPIRQIALQDSVPEFVMNMIRLHPIATDVAVLAAFWPAMIVPAVWLFGRQE